MANNLYITAAEEKSGKSAVVLGMMQLLLQNVRKVAIFRPIIGQPLYAGAKDHDIQLVLKHFELDLPYEASYAYTLQEARELSTRGQTPTMLDMILKKYNALEANYDFVLCEGTDFAGKESAFEFDLNTEIAANLGCPILLVGNAAGKSPEEFTASTLLTLEQLWEKNLDVVGCISNRAQFSSSESKKIVKAITAQGARNGQPFSTYVLPEEPTLGKPTVADVKKWLGAEILYGEERIDTLVDDYVIAAMHVGNFLSYLTENCLVITPGDREDIVLATMACRHSGAYPTPAAVVLTGGIDLPPALHRLIKGWTGSPVPILKVQDATFKTAQTISHLYGRIEPEDARKINTALGHFEEHVSGQELAKRLINRKSSKITPKMFEFKLIEQAKRSRMRIVLPEGEEERILQAADILCRRDVAEIILLGDATTVCTNIKNLGLDLAATILQPDKSPYFEEYAQAYAEARKAKGISLEQARDIMADPTYFATMMVHKGAADGMVSGAIHTTAHTIRPAFEFIKTKPGASIVSSVFLMCLKDRVLAFGDCAVNPNPTPEQLASIAISSAETAKLFGIEPRVAMLSYSTGASGKGEDVERVIEATRIAKERAPELLLEGPLQYDAAIDPDVAKTKLPDSKVAGHATVFIFPDLNTGNNTYKAVQRAADAVAIGPVLQGLNKPVNDLSRGCTVADIVNTVAITAIQAQAQKGLI